MTHPVITTARPSTDVGGDASSAREAPLTPPSAGATRVVAAGLVLSKPAAYLREAILAARFGTGRSMDVFTLAMTTAQAAWAVVGTPLSRVLIPVLVRARSARGERGLAATSGAVLWAALAISVLLGIGLLALSSPLSLLLTGGGPARSGLAVLLRWLSPLPLALTLSTFATGWLQARERFTLPAFVALPVDLGIIGFVLFDGRHGALAAAWGLLVGTTLQFVWQWPGLRYHRWRAPLPTGPRQALADPGVAAVSGMAIPLLVSVGAQQAANLLQQALAARLGVGNVAALNYATRVLDLPSAVFTLPIVTVALPHFAALATAARVQEANQTLRRTVDRLLAALLPCTLFILLLRRGIAAAIFEHGAFGHLSVLATAGALAGYAPLAVGYGLQALLRVFFYAKQDVRTPMIWDIVNLVVTGGLDLALAHAMGQVGLAFGMSIGTLVAGVGMWVTAVRAAGGASGGGGLGGTAGRAESTTVRPARPVRVVAPLVLGSLALIAVTAVVGRMPELQGAGWLHAAVLVSAAGSAGSLAYVAVFSLAGGGPVLRDLVGIARAARAGRGAVRPDEP